MLTLLQKRKQARLPHRGVYPEHRRRAPRNDNLLVAAMPRCVLGPATPLRQKSAPENAFFLECFMKNKWSSGLSGRASGKNAAISGQNRIRDKMRQAVTSGHKWSHSEGGSLKGEE